MNLGSELITARAPAFTAGAACAVALLLAGCNRSAPANVAATVNGRSITYAELDKQYLSQFPPTGESSTTDDQESIQRLEVLRTLIDNEIMLQRAEKTGLMAADSEVEAKFTELKAPYTQEEFQKQLGERKMSAEDLKAQLRRDLSVQKLFNKEITSQITISDKDITDFYNSNKSSFNLAEPQIHMAQILVTPQPDPNVRNLKNDKAQDDKQARKKIESMLLRIKQGEDFAMLAQNYSEDANSAQAGGDLGFIAESGLEKANADIRKAILSLRPGENTGVVPTSEGYRILKLITREPAGQRDLGDPKVQQTIRETLINRKDQLLKAAYYEVARNEAKVANYYADRVIGNKK
ncbi:MAG TPA: peptidylprolyl isomerase [Bryobacteraceae bacterium]|nr:peptidylprolyl isomerase [Bryobacteraceae bacterium]